MGGTGEDDQVKRNELCQSILGFGHQRRASWEAFKVNYMETKARFVKAWSKGTLEEMEAV